MKQLLFITASSDVCAAEKAHIQAVCDLFGMKMCAVELSEIDDFESNLCDGLKYDYIYLATHANIEGFGDPSKAKLIQWEVFATVLCTTNCLNSGCVLLLACCRGGLKRVASTLFLSCGQIDYICGPRWTVNSQDLTTGFHVFVYNLEVRREQPSTAVKRVSQATGYDFFCYDRVETEDEYLAKVDFYYPDGSSEIPNTVS